MRFDRLFARLAEFRITVGLAAVVGAALLPVSTVLAADPIASPLQHPNSRGACRSRAAVPTRFAGSSPAAPSAAAGAAGRMRVESHGEQLLVSAHGVLALVSAPAGSRGGGVIEGVTHRLSGGDLLVGTDRAAARAWEVCIGTRRTNPDSCAPDGRWVDSRSMPVRWRAEQRPSGDVLRFDWVDEAVGLSVAQEIAVEDDGLRLRLSARALGLASGLVAARFPIVAIDYQGHGGLGAELVLPRGNFGIQCRDCGAFAAMYPGIYQTMPWFGVLKAQAGLYVGAHDPKGSMKRVVVSGPRTPGSSYFEIYPEDSGAAGNAIEPDWSFDVTPVCAERGWPALAHHYKEWMSAHTEWGRAPLLRERDDIPAAVRDGAWWFVHSIVPGAGIDLLEQGTQLWRQGFAGLPTIHHWYEWHTPGMDRGFPTHRPKPGTKEAIARLHANPLTRILLFTNATHSDQSTAPVESGRPPCPNGASEYPRYWHETIQRADFTRVFIVPLSGACLAAMDLTAPGWRGVVLANSDLVTKKLGAAGVYLDVIGNSGEGSWMPVRHPPGRGEWVTRAARELVQAVSNGRELVVVEGALEQMTGISSAGLNYLGSTTDMVPLFSLVHHERFILAGMISLPPDDRHALRIKNGLALAWGLQMGLSSLQWHEPHAARNVAWGAELLRARHRFANWLAYGEYMGPVDQVEAGLSAEKVESKSWGAFIDDRPTVVHQRNPIEASLYRGADGRPALILVNLSERRATARLALPPPFDRARARVVSASEDASKARVVASEGGVLELALAPGAIVRGELLVDGAATGSPAQLPGMPRKAQVSPTRAPGS